MRLFIYYALHSFWNQIRKLFKTWVAVFFLICMLFGGIIGITIGMLEDAFPADDPNDQEEILPPEQQEPIAPDDADEEIDPLVVQASAGLIASGLTLGLLCLAIYNGTKSGSAIFLMADVNLLFPAPLRPQSVLFFRLTNQIALQIMAGAYFLFQLPMLCSEFDLVLWQALLLVLGVVLLLLTYQLTTVLVYTLGSVSVRLKSLFKPLALALPLLALLPLAADLSAGKGFWQTALSVYGTEALDPIPFVGWMGGIIRSALAANLPAALLYLALTLLACLAILLLIYHLRVDFYEDALQSASKNEQIREAAQNGSTGVKTRKKPRSEKLRRDGLKHGSGASVFFFRTLYNRFRFTPFGMLSVACIVYLLAVASVLFFAESLGTQAPIICFVMLVVLVFYHATTTPANTDIAFSGFSLIPAHSFSKLFYSVAGGTLCTALDLLPATLLVALMTDISLSSCLLWYLLICTTDILTTAILVFLDCTLPTSINQQIKTLIVILFLYFGLIPLGIGFAIGLLNDAIPLFCLIALLAQLVLGAVFIGISALSLSEGRR